MASRTNGSIHSEPAIKTSNSGKMPPPRPPPPMFIRQSDIQAAPANSTAGTDWSAVSRSDTPPTLPSTSPPPLSDDGLLDFEIPDDDAASTTKSVMTDVVEIHDKVKTTSRCTSHSNNFEMSMPTATGIGWRGRGSGAEADHHHSGPSHWLVRQH